MLLLKFKNKKSYHIIKNVRNKLVFVPDRSFQPIRMFVGKARSLL